MSCNVRDILHSKDRPKVKKSKKNKPTPVIVTVGHVLQMAQNMSQIANSMGDQALLDRAQTLINAITRIQVSANVAELLAKHSAVFQKQLREIIETRQAAEQAVTAESATQPSPDSERTETHTAVPEAARQPRCTREAYIGGGSPSPSECERCGQGPCPDIKVSVSDKTITEQSPPDDVFADLARRGAREQADEYARIINGSEFPL